MELKLSDLDNYKLSDIDFLTIEQLETMTPQDLVTAVEAVRKIAESRCNPNQLLNERQCVYIVKINHEHKSLFGNKKEFTPKQLSIAAALGIVQTLTGLAIKYVITNWEEIKPALIQSYLLIKDLLN
ncbi:MAG: hypothetical protein IKY16_06625 [Bacteroidales bacterium]|nr:hypothetical protein [Bacteroidales bacterium]